MTKEEQIKEIIRTRFNNVDTPEIRNQIARTFVLDDGKRSQFKIEGMSYNDSLDVHRRAANAAAWEKKQNDEMNAPEISDSKQAAEMMVQLKEDQLNSCHDPSQKKRLERQLVEARSELGDVIAREKQQANQEAIQHKIDNTPMFANAISNAEAEISLANGEDDFKSALLRLERLKTVNDPSQINSAITAYWQDQKSFEESKEKRLHDESLPLMKDAMDSENKALDSDRLIQESRHKQEIAEIEIRGAEDV